MSKKHNDALKSFIEEIPPLATKTFEAIAKYPYPDASVKVLPPYLLMFPSDGKNTSERVALRPRTRHPRWTLHLVGSSADQVGDIAELLTAHLLPDDRGAVLAVAGEVCKPLWLDSPLPLQVIDNATPALVYQVFECGLDADPLP